MKYSTPIALFGLMTLIAGTASGDAKTMATQATWDTVERDDLATVYHLADLHDVWAARFTVATTPADTTVASFSAIDAVLQGILVPPEEWSAEHPPVLPAAHGTIATALIQVIAESSATEENLDSSTAAYMEFFERIRRQRDEGDVAFPDGEPAAYLWYVEGQLQRLLTGACQGDEACMHGRLQAATVAFESSARTAVSSRARHVALVSAAETYFEYVVVPNITADQLLAARQNAVARILEAAAYTAEDLSVEEEVGTYLSALASQAFDAERYDLTTTVGNWAWQYTNGGLDLRGLVGGTRAAETADVATGASASVLPGPITTPLWRDVSTTTTPIHRTPVLTGDFDRSPRVYYWFTRAEHRKLDQVRKRTAKDAFSCATSLSHFRDSVDEKVDGPLTAGLHKELTALTTSLLSTQANYCGDDYPAVRAIKADLQVLQGEIATQQVAASVAAAPTLVDELKAKIPEKGPQDEIAVAEALVRSIHATQFLHVSLSHGVASNARFDDQTPRDAIVLVPAFASLLADRMVMRSVQGNHEEEARALAVVGEALTLVATDLMSLGTSAEDTAAHVLVRAEDLTKKSHSVDMDLLARLQGSLAAGVSPATLTQRGSLGGVVLVYGTRAELKGWFDEQTVMAPDWGMRAADVTADPAQRTLGALAATGFRESLLLVSSGMEVTVWSRSRTGVLDVSLPPVYGMQLLEQDGPHQTLTLEVPAPGQQVVVALDHATRLRVAGQSAAAARGTSQNPHSTTR